MALVGNRVPGVGGSGTQEAEEREGKRDRETWEESTLQGQGAANQTGEQRRQTEIRRQGRKETGS